MENRDELLTAVEEIEEEIIALSDKIGKNPEPGFKEYRACRWLTDLLQAHGFAVDTGAGGLETAFCAGYNFSNTGSGPTIAFLCEYDALPEIGHGCGHNMIGAMSAGAGIALSKLQGLRGRILVIGCPGEEVGGSKVTLVEKGIFTGVDAALMIHPATENVVYSTSLALETLKFVYHGKPAHAASSPEEGINALDGVIQLFNGINAMREHVRDDVRIHGIITRGGESPNVVPAVAEARFYFRAGDKGYLQEVLKRGKEIARGAALMTGCEVEWMPFEEANDNLQPSKTLAGVFENNLRELGVSDISPARDSSGSTDMGNVSQVVPAIHPYLEIGKKITNHTEQFAAATMSERGHRTLATGIKALSLTGLDLLEDDDLLIEIREEFKRRKE